MEDEELVRLNNACADLLASKKWEDFPRHLLGRNHGEWVGARALCRQAGINLDDIPADLFVTWLADPSGAEGYAIIMFYEADSSWTMAAHYNRQRLVGAAAAGEQKTSVSKSA
jgi:hypothetical protein